MNAEQRRHWRAALAQAERETGISRYELWMSYQRADACLRQDPAAFCAQVAAQYAADNLGKLGVREEFLSHLVAALALPLDPRLASVITQRASEILAAARLQAAADQATRVAGDGAAQSAQEFARERPDFDRLRPRIYKLMAAGDYAGREVTLERAYELALIEERIDVKAPTVVAA